MNPHRRVESSDTNLQFITCGSPAEWKGDEVRQQVRIHATRRMHQLRRSQEPFRAFTAPGTKSASLSKSQTHTRPLLDDVALLTWTSLLEKDTHGTISSCLEMLRFDLDNLANLCNITLETNAKSIDAVSTQYHALQSSDSTFIQLRLLVFSDYLPFSVLLLQTISGLSKEVSEHRISDYETMILRLRGLTLSMISERVSSKEKHSLGDAFLCAVALLAVFEATQGNDEHCAVHTRSLQQFLEMRVTVPRTKGILLRLLLWVDRRTENSLHAA